MIVQTIEKPVEVIQVIEKVVQTEVIKTEIREVPVLEQKIVTQEVVKPVEVVRDRIIENVREVPVEV